MLRITSLMVCLASAVASLGFMFYTGRYNKSVLLMLMFTGWVLSPFVALLAAYWFADRLKAASSIYYTSITISLVSVLVYSELIQIPDVRPAFIYLICPLVSWILIIVIYWAKLRVK